MKGFSAITKVGLSTLKETFDFSIMSHMALLGSIIPLPMTFPRPVDHHAVGQPWLISLQKDC